MRGRRPLTSRERESLNELLSAAKDVRVFRRAQMLLLHDRGETARAIGEIVGRHPATVSRWVRRFLRGGVEALRDRPRIGRPPKATPEYVDLLEREARKAPWICGVDRTTWTASLLAEHLEDLTGIRLGEDRVLQLLRQRDIRFRRPVLHLVSPDPDYEKKRGAPNAW
jgi:transposase